MESMFGVWLEEQRAKNGLTKTQMSEKLKISVGQYSAYITGKSTPRSQTLEKVSGTFSVSVDDLREMLKTHPSAIPPAEEAPPDDEIVAAPAQASELAAQVAAAQNKILEGKLDLIIAMLSDISNRLPK